MNEFLVSANDVHSGSERRMKAAWEGGRWVCVPLLQARERREGKEGREVEELYAPMSHAVGVKGDSSRYQRKNKKFSN